MKLLARLLLLTCSFASATEYYDKYIDKVYAKCDGDTDGKLSTAEMLLFISKVDVDSEMTAAQMTAATLVSEADTDLDGGVVKAELIAWVVNSQSHENAAKQALADAIIKGMTGINTDLAATTSGIGVVNTAVSESKAYVELKFTMATNPEDLFMGERKQLRQTIINLMDVPSVTDPGDLFMTISAGSSNVEAKAFTPTTAEASTAKSNLATALPDKETASQNLGQEVESTPTITEGQPYPGATADFGLPVAVAVIAILLGVFAIFLGKFVAKKQLEKSEAKYSNCCSTGCCSPYALKGWSMGSIVAVIFLLSGAFLIFVSFGKVKDDIVCIMDKLDKLKDLEGDVGESMESIEDTLDMMNTVKPYVQMMHLFAIVPAVLASLTMLGSAACGARNAKTMKWMKCLAFLSMLLLILCIVFYAVFSAMGILITYDDVQEQFIKVTSLCETTLPVIKQTLTDAQIAVDQANALSGVSDGDMKELQDKLANAEPAYEIFDGVCDCINNLFFSINELFVPGLVCVFASIYALFSMFAMCCAGNCCCYPKRKMAFGKVSPV